MAYRDETGKYLMEKGEAPGYCARYVLAICGRCQAAETFDNEAAARKEGWARRTVWGLLCNSCLADLRKK